MTKDFAQLIADNVHDHYFKFFLSENVRIYTRNCYNLFYYLKQTSNRIRISKIIYIKKKNHKILKWKYSRFCDFFISTNFNPKRPLISPTPRRKLIDERRKLGTFSRKRARRSHTQKNIYPPLVSTQLIVTLHEVTRTWLCTKRKIDNLSACAPINPERKWARGIVRWWIIRRRERVPVYQ